MIYVTNVIYVTYFYMCYISLNKKQVYLFEIILVISDNSILMMMKAIFPVMVINIRDDLVHTLICYSLISYLSFAFATHQTLHQYV